MSPEQAEAAPVDKRTDISSYGVVGVPDLKAGNDLLLLDLETGNARPLIRSRFNDRFGRFSPDGKWIAVGSDESGREEIYVLPYPGLGARAQVSTDGGSQPVWSRDGGELFYRSAREVMVAAVTSRSPLAFAPPRALFSDRFARPQVGDHTTFDGCGSAVCARPHRGVRIVPEEE